MEMHKQRNSLNSVLIIVKQFITHYGFSYGYADLEFPENQKQQIFGDIEKRMIQYLI